MIHHVIILGSQGMLGSYLTDYFREKCNSFRVYPITRDQFPVPECKEKVFDFASTLFNPNDSQDTVWVLNAVGLTNKMDVDEKTFFRVNGEYSHWWYEVCCAKHWQYVYFSTDCVFSGQVQDDDHKGYTERSSPDAVDVYGQSKIAGECGMVVRASIIGEDARNFRGFIEFAKRNHHQTVEGYTNHTWNGITCLTMAQFMAHCIDKDISWSGIRHLVPGYTVTKYDMLKMVNEIWQLQLKIIPTEAVTPKQMILSTTMTDSNKLFTFPDLKTQLHDLKAWKNIPNDQHLFRKVLIIGGSGSLGHALIHQWQNRMSECIIFSRSEHKQWELVQKFPQVKFQLELGDVANSDRISEVLLDHKPDTIIYAAAMKHVDRCETAVRLCLNTNCLGFLNLLEAVKIIRQNESQLQTQKILYVSTDKACHPINVYGMTKSISEHLVQQYSIPKVTLVGVRYGNVINSNGSIIPVLKHQGLDPNYKSFTLTDPKMTRFYMTLPQSVQLIEDCLVYGRSGELWIPKLRSMSIKTLFDIFSRKYGKEIKVVGRRLGEKVHEDLLDIHELSYTRQYKVDNRTSFIVGKGKENETASWDYSSAENLIDREELTRLLSQDNML